MLTAMYKSSHFYMQSLLYVTVCFTRFFIGFVDGAYIPNYGFVGCYLYTNHMEQFTGFNQASNVLGPTTVHSCVQSCMQRDWEYAGLMADSRCFCGRSYNQTFAVDQRHCSIECRSPCVGAKHMAVYNTDYDVKPLLSIPGNNTNFLEVWNKALVGQLDGFADVFLDDVLRNSDIDWWNKTKLYHTPEYVSVMLFNRYGHPLWSIDFFTNDTNSANVEDWLRKERILPNKYFTNSMKNNAAISISDEKITIRHKQENKVWFAHGNLNNREARVTVFDPQRNTVGQSETHTEETYLKCSEYHNSEKCKMNLSRSAACDCENKVDGACLEYKVKRSDQQQKTACLVSFKPTCTSECVKDVCYTDGNNNWSCNSTRDGNKEYWLFTIGPNYGLQRMEQVKANRTDCKDEHEENKPFYICGIEVSDYIGTLELEFWPNEEVNESKSVTIDLSRNPKPLSCIYTQRMKLKFPNPQQQCTFHFYKPKNDALIMVDRVAVLGFYHREEPKVSKWEFLNNYSIDEIKNIMRPVLQKARAATQVQVRNLSSSIRKKESATDFRTSSQGIGILGGFLLGMVFLVIFVSDIFVLRAHLKMMFRNVSSCFKHSKKVNQHDQGND
ncbi:uncharacterized protein LOC125658272 [Ostrea edulis]|uniref:uncharacterized protein LOC125658272 n=1 Tax=Ostrea edulis TaxID=37623 RepID=UPI0024AF3A57|nr:uncharacterized protein LOC125658272 [Ostrea edulis]